MTPTEPVAVELIDRLGEYWEVLAVRRSLKSVLRKTGKMVTDADRSAFFRNFNLAATIANGVISIAFDCGDQEQAETWATLFAQSVGWREEHGVLIGRVRT